MNQELEQYLRLFVKHRQKNWPEWLATAEFAVNNKVHTATKVSPFMANYGKELRMGGDIRRKGKVESATAFMERMKKVQEEAEAALKKTQEEMKRYADRGRKETEEWKKGDRVLLSTKDLVFKERPSKKLMKRYVSVIYRSTCPENYIPAVMPPLNHTSPPFSQHVSWWYCNSLGIPSSTMEILLFNSVFHDRVAPVSVSTLKLLLRIIEVVTTETPSISYTFHLYIRLVVTL